MDMYNKIFTKILDSSIWLESNTTRIVWLTFLASMDENGFCQFASTANLAHRARVTDSDSEAAVTCLSSPDANSSDPDNEGRRIERVPGGWIVLNAEKYRAIVTRAVAQEKARSRVAEWRAKHKRPVTVSNAGVTVGNGTKQNNTPSETVSEAESDTSKTPPATPPESKPRPRNPLFDGLAKACGNDPDQMTASAARACGVALSAISKVCSVLTEAEIARRAANYRTHMTKAVLTPSALANNWALCDNPSANAAPVNRHRAAFA